MKLFGKLKALAIVAALSMILPVFAAKPAMASGSCAIGGSLSSYGLTVTRYAGSCSEVGAQDEYSSDGVHMHWTTPTYGYYSADALFDTSPSITHIPDTAGTDLGGK